MDKATLITELQRLGVNLRAYSLDGGIVEEQYCVERVGDSWIAYYAERGEKVGLQRFATAEHAYDRLFEWIKGDASCYF